MHCHVRRLLNTMTWDQRGENRLDAFRKHNGPISIVERRRWRKEKQNRYGTRSNVIRKRLLIEQCCENTHQRIQQQDIVTICCQRKKSFEANRIYIYIFLCEVRPEHILNNFYWMTLRSKFSPENHGCWSVIEKSDDLFFCSSFVLGMF